MTSYNDDKYLKKYLKYKQKYELLDNKNNISGGGWLFSSSKKKKDIEKKDTRSEYNILYDNILKHSYFKLFFEDIPNKLNELYENKKIELQTGGAVQYDNQQYNQEYYNQEYYNQEYEDDLYYKGGTEKKSAKRLVLWKISNIIYKELFADKAYPELSYNNRMTNLKSYIIVVIIRKIFQTESLSVNDLNFDELIKKFKKIGIYIYIKLYQLLHYHGNVQFKYISNNYAPVNHTDKINNILDTINNIITYFNNELLKKNESNIYLDLIKLYNVKLDDLSKNLDVKIINILNTIENSEEFKSIIDMEETYFFNAFIELTVSQTLYADKN